MLVKLVRLLLLVVSLQGGAAYGFDQSFDQVRNRYQSSDAFLLDRQGMVIDQQRVVQQGRRLEWVALDDVSPALKRVILQAEDHRFYDHHGVDWLAMGSALLHGAGGVRGASTISMQLVALLDRNLRGTANRKTLWQKVQQVQAAQELERIWSKDEILEAYLNLVSFRGEIQGLAAASTGYFGKRPHGLTERESVILAALLPAPNADVERVVTRACALARGKQMEESCGTITENVRELLSKPPVFVQRENLAPHVAIQVLSRSEAREQNPSKSVTTTLDGQVQRVALESLRQQLQALRSQHVEDGAVLVVENATGEVLAYVGSSGELSRARHVDGVRAKRQAGSILKPFLYGTAFDSKVLTPATLLDDSPLEVSVENGIYRPKNYDRQFRGLVTARTALASSLNVPAVNVLRLVGEDAFVRRLQLIGFTGLQEEGNFYGPSLALGSADISLWDVVNAYRTLANGGVRTPLRLVAGAVSGQEPVRVFSSQAAFLIADILSDREARSATFGWESPLASRFWSAVKTGTSKDMRDNWCVGYTDHYTVGVWVGNFSGEPMWNVSGVSGAAPVWLDVMNWLHRDAAKTARTVPQGIIRKHVSFSSGEPTRTEWFVTGTEPRATKSLVPHRQPRIAYPVAGMVLAPDPDIPAGQQQIFFEAHPSDSDYRWQLNGADMGSAVALTIWEPVAGTHRLALIGPDQREVETVEFTVRDVTQSREVEAGLADDHPR
ncbi:MAG: penicillin-binding protein 1C [Nitrospira sp.]|nr:penicillin-binding protein 1C [Nitrospira sp.]